MEGHILSKEYNILFKSASIYSQRDQKIKLIIRDVYDQNYTKGNVVVWFARASF